jgi:hypothetical protein
MSQTDLLPGVKSHRTNVTINPWLLRKDLSMVALGVCSGLYPACLHDFACHVVHIVNKSETFHTFIRMLFNFVLVCCPINVQLIIYSASTHPSNPSRFYYNVVTPSMFVGLVYKLQQLHTVQLLL